MSSLHHQEPPRDFARSNTSVLALQAEEPMLTLLALLAPEFCCTSQAEEPMLTLLVSQTSPTSRGTNVDLACLTSTRVLLHFTSRGTYVDLACIPDLAHKPRNQC